MSVMSTMLEAIASRFATVTGATAGGQVILRDLTDTPRPKPPYVTLGWLTLGDPQGETERIVTQNSEGAWVVQKRTPMLASLSIQGYGEITSDWLLCFQNELGDVQNVRLIGEGAQCSVYNSGNVRDVTVLLNSSRERRYSLDLDVGYNLITEREVLEVADVQVDMVYDSPVAGDLEDTFFVDADANGAATVIIPAYMGGII